MATVKPGCWSLATDVNLEQEFLKSNEVMQGYTLNTQIMKTFDSMLQSVTKA